jgi:anion-transporting  ArsA/GET3 family ATPase
MKMVSILEQLSNKELLLVTGKGGAGKSAIASALALTHARLGKKVLLVELGHRDSGQFSRLYEMLGVKSLSNKAQEVEKNLWAAQLAPQAALAEYINLKLPTGGLAGRLLNNSVTGSFLEVVPGLTEIVSMGKLWYSCTQKQEYDQVIIDGPASGHSHTILKAPGNFARLTKRGPLFRDASAMDAWYKNDEKTGIVFASIPETMSLEESSEYSASVRKEFHAPFLVVNKIFPAPEKASKIVDPVLKSAYEYSVRRHAREAEDLESIQKKHFSAIIEVPFFFPKRDGATDLVKNICNYFREGEE